MKNSPPKKSPQPTAVRQTTQEILYQGPVPPPHIMEQLERLLPGAADRIFTMAEKDQDAAHEAQRLTHERADRQEENQHKENMTALWMAFSICLVFAVGGILLVLNGYEKIGAALIGTTLLGVVGSFLGQKRRK